MQDQLDTETTQSNLHFTQPTFTNVSWACLGCLRLTLLFLASGHIAPGPVAATQVLS